MRLVLEIFDISTLKISLWLFEHHTFQKQKSLSIFPSQILICATSFCSSISLFIWRFTFSEFYLQKHKNKSGKIYRHKFMQASRQTRLLTNHSWQAFAARYLFSFGDLHLVSSICKNIKIKVGRYIGTSLCNHQDKQDYWPIIHDKFEDLFTAITHSFQDIFHLDKCAYRYKLSS